MRPQTESHRQKIAQAKAARVSGRSIRFAAGKWTLFYFDPFNWAIRKTSEIEDASAETKYYPSLRSGFQALLQLAIEERAAEVSTLRDVLTAIADAEARVSALLTDEFVQRIGP